ncbi:hypothetical protein B0H13DRAFT_2380485 [Mycena leptocephala]|nr:hypothetical protein B0H13DRAFT_2380485 [Mycena leptocephala]
MKVENENEMEMDTAHSRISVQMLVSVEMKKRECVYRSAREREVEPSTPLPIRLSMGMRMETEVQRRVPRYCVCTRARNRRFLWRARNGTLPRCLHDPSSCEYGLQMHAHRDLNTTLGVDVRARSSVEVGILVISPLAVERRAGFAPRLLCLYAHTNPRDGEAGVSHRASASAHTPSK